MKRLFDLLMTALLLAAASPVLAQTAAPPAPPSNLRAQDHPLDGGEQIDLIWTLSPDDKPLSPEQKKAGAQPAVALYIVQRSQELNGRYEEALRVTPDKWDYERGEMKGTVEKSQRGEPYFFKVMAVGPAGARSEPVTTTQPAMAVQQLFDGGRFWLAVITLTVCGSVVLFIVLARQGMNLKVRKIAGLQAVDEAVGRATEMGRPVLYVAGTQDLNDIQTYDGTTDVGRVAKTAAEYDAKVEVPTSRSLVMTTARETVQAAFLAAGRPDAYNQDLIYYVTDEQFGFVAYLSGLMVRKKPAACFYMGAFFAESLILAETGNSIGAIQVAGTAQPAQLPFFVAACDYTLIGEEFFAASAYLSGEPEQLGSLKGQDVGKVVVAILLLAGCVLMTLAAWSASDTSELHRVSEYLTETVLQ